MEEHYQLAKWLNNELNNDELKIFQQSADFEIFEKIKNYTSELETTSFDSEKMLSNVLNSKSNPSKIRTLFGSKFYKIAAVFTVFIAITAFYFSNKQTQVLAENGITKQIYLPDNSLVTLNSESNIAFQKWNWNNNRNINLNGEAFFKVAKGKTFEVITSLGNVQVLGTQFNVKSRKNRFDVTCFEGKVKIKYQNKNLIITKGETVSFENNKKLFFKKINEIEPFWTQNMVSFDSEKLEDVCAELERKYAVKINLNNCKSTQLFTGKIPNNNIDVALKLLTSTYLITYKKINENTYTLEHIN